MGNVLAQPTKLQLDLLAEVPNVVYKDTLNGGRFLKTLLCVHDEGGLVVVKVYYKRPDSPSLDPYRQQLISLRERLYFAPHPHVLPYQAWVETPTAGYVIRQYMASNLYDRLSTRPFLTAAEKRWVTLQLLAALTQAHAQGVVHGDIKCENVLLSSWQWLLLSDFAPFKPTYLRAELPSDFSFYFDTGGRRRCYIAPERFVDGQQQAQQGNSSSSSSGNGGGGGNSGGGSAATAAAAAAAAANGELLPLLPAMDVFSAGCVLAELFLDGRAFFDLSQLLAYRAGRYNPATALAGLDPDVASLITHMTQRDPAKRATAGEYLATAQLQLVPPCYSRLLHPFFRMTLFMDADQRVAVTAQVFEALVAELCGGGGDGGGGASSSGSGANGSDGVVTAAPAVAAAVAVARSALARLLQQSDALAAAAASRAASAPSRVNSSGYGTPLSPSKPLPPQVAAAIASAVADAVAPPTPAVPSGGVPTSAPASQQHRERGPLSLAQDAQLLLQQLQTEAEREASRGLDGGFLLDDDDDADDNNEADNDEGDETKKAEGSEEGEGRKATESEGGSVIGDSAVQPEASSSGAAGRAAAAAAPKTAIDELVTEEAFEFQVRRRQPDGGWGDWQVPAPGEAPGPDLSGAGRRREQVTLPAESGWVWASDWLLPSRPGRSCDADGWQYRCISGVSTGVSSSGGSGGGGGGGGALPAASEGGSAQQQPAAGSRAASQWSEACSDEARVRRRRWVRRRRRQLTSGSGHDTSAAANVDTAADGTTAVPPASDTAASGPAAAAAASCSSAHATSGSSGTGVSSSSGGALSDASGMVLVAVMLCSTLRGAKLQQSREVAIRLLVRAALLCDDNLILQCAVPYLLTQTADRTAAVRAAAVRAVVRLMGSVCSTPPGDERVFQDFIFPSLSSLPFDADELVRVEFARGLSQLAFAAQRHLMRLHAAAAAGASAAAAAGSAAAAAAVGGSTDGAATPPNGGTTGAALQAVPAAPTIPTAATTTSAMSAAAAAAALRSSSADLTALRKSVERVMQDLVGARSSGKDSRFPTKRALLAAAPRLADFFGKSYVNNAVIPLLFTCLNAADWQLRSSFHGAVSRLGRVTGPDALVLFLFPCIDQALMEASSRSAQQREGERGSESASVAADAVRGFGPLAGHLVPRKRSLLQVCAKVAPLLQHGSAAVRAAATATLAAAARALSPVDRFTQLLPMLQPYCRAEPLSLTDERLLCEAVSPLLLLKSPSGDSSDNDGDDDDAVSIDQDDDDNGAAQLNSVADGGRVLQLQGPTPAFSTTPRRWAGGRGEQQQQQQQQQQQRLSSSSGAFKTAGSGASLSGTAAAGDSLSPFGAAAFARASGTNAGLPARASSTNLGAIRTTPDSPHRAADGASAGAAAAGSGQQPSGSSPPAPASAYVGPPSKFPFLVQPRGLGPGGVGGAASAGGVGGPGAGAGRSAECADSFEVIRPHAPVYVFELDGTTTAAPQPPLPSAALPQTASAAGATAAAAAALAARPYTRSLHSVALEAINDKVAAMEARLRLTQSATRRGGGSGGEASAGGGSGAPQVPSAEASIERAAADKAASSLAQLKAAAGVDVRSPATLATYKLAALSTKLASHPELLQQARARGLGGGGGHGSGSLLLYRSTADVSSAPASAGGAAAVLGGGGPGGLPGAGGGGMGSGAASEVSAAMSTGLLGAAGVYADYSAPAWRPRGVLVAHLAEHRSAVNQLAVSSNGAFLVSASSDETVKIWDLARLQRDVSFHSRLTYAAQAGRITSVTPAEGDQSVASASAAGTLHVWRVEYTTRAAQAAPDGGTGGGSGVQPDRYCDIAGLQQYCPSQGAVLQVATWSPHLLVYVTQAGGVHAWDLRAPAGDAWRLPLVAREGLLESLLLDPQGNNWLLTGSSKGWLSVWDVRFQLRTNAWQHPAAVTSSPAARPPSSSLAGAAAGASAAGHQGSSSSSSSSSGSVPINSLALAIAAPSRLGINFSGSCPLVYVGAGHQEAGLWDLASGHCHMVLRAVEGEAAGQPRPAALSGQSAAAAATRGGGGGSGLPAVSAAAASPWPQATPSRRGLAFAPFAATGTLAPPPGAHSNGVALAAELQTAFGRVVAAAPTGGGGGGGLSAPALRSLDLDQLTNPQPRQPGFRCLLPTTTGQLLTGGSDRCIRYWDTTGAATSAFSAHSCYMVAGPLWPHAAADATGGQLSVPEYEYGYLCRRYDSVPVVEEVRRQRGSVVLSEGSAEGRQRMRLNEQSHSDCVTHMVAVGGGLGGGSGGGKMLVSCSRDGGIKAWR